MPERRQKRTKQRGGRPSSGARCGEIHIEIDPSGNMRIETVGTVGRQCDLLAGALEESLGQVTSRTDKETYEDGEG